MNAADKLIEVLESEGIPVIRQGSMTENEEYPQKFFTFWNPECEEIHYNNESRFELVTFEVNFYSTDPEEIYEIMKKTRRKLREKGFTVIDPGHDVESDEATHTGRGMTVNYREAEEK